jgi:hypothetical protein
VPFNKFFVAWSDSYAPGSIQMQLFSLDSRQDRQYVDWWVNPQTLAFAAANPGRLYIDGDEPDQTCMAPADYAVMYHDFVTAIRGADRTARVSPAGFAEANYHCCPPPGVEPCISDLHSIGYATQFYNAYIKLYGGPPPVDEWRFHDFGISIQIGDVSAWWSRVQTLASWSVAHGANMVLATWGFTNWSESQAAHQEHMKQAMGLIMSDSRILGAVYWSYQPWVYSPYYLANSDGSLTPSGQTFVNPLTDVPTGLKIVGANASAKLRWNNTTAAWPAEVEFWVQAPGSSSFVYRSTQFVTSAGSDQSLYSSFNVGESVRARVRYYNVFGQAPWSAFSNTVSLASSGDQSNVPGKWPVPCLSPSC